jgi:hypothetical protein
VLLQVIYDPQVFSDKTISNMKTQFDSFVQLTKTDQPMLDDMLSWLPQHPSLPSPTTTNLPTTNPNRHIHNFFDAHAHSTPTSMAIQTHEKVISITYGELYASSERKAQSQCSRPSSCWIV